MKVIDKFAEAIKKNIRNSNLSLLIIIFIFLFILPFMQPVMYRIFFEVFFLGIFVAAALTSGKLFKKILFITLTISTIEFVSYLLSMKYLLMISRFTSFLFLILITIMLIRDVAKSKRVTLLVLLQAVNGYLLLGIAFSLIVVFIELINPGAFQLGTTSTDKIEFINVSYYTFITMTTLGYGDGSWSDCVSVFYKAAEH